MSEAMQQTATSAPLHGPRWGARAEDWAKLAASFSLGEARRVARRRGFVAVCNWGRRQDNDLFSVIEALGPLQPPPFSEARPRRSPAFGEPGVVEELARGIGLEPVQTGEVATPLEAPDPATLARALLSPGGVQPAIEHAGEEAVRKAIIDAAAPFRRPDGSYRL